MAGALVRFFRALLERVRGCAHAGRILPLGYHVLEGGVVVELGECERCGAQVAR